MRSIAFLDGLNTTKLFVLIILCLQNTLYTLLRRYSLGVLRETYSKYEVLLVAEVIKIVFSAFMVNGAVHGTRLSYLWYLIKKSGKMVLLACIYGSMNILSFVALRNIGAGTFTIFSQCKILSTALFSTLLLNRSYSWSRWRALVTLMLGVLLFTEPIWSQKEEVQQGNVVLGTVAVITEVTLSGFASIYFEKVIKTDPEQLGIWERNFQLALGSFPIYILFILWEGGGEAGFGGGWSMVAVMLSSLGAAGGLLVALAIKHGDSVVKTLATTAAIVLSAAFDAMWLDGLLTPVMMIGGALVIVSIMNYAFDPTPVEPTSSSTLPNKTILANDEEQVELMENGSAHKQSTPTVEK